MGSITTEDRASVSVGDHVYNYYDMMPCVIVSEPDDAGWFDVKHYDGRTTMLDGSRICTIRKAARLGYRRAVEFHKPNGLLGKTQLPKVTDEQLTKLAELYDVLDGPLEIIDHVPDFSVDAITVIQHEPSPNDQATQIFPDGSYTQWTVEA